MPAKNIDKVKKNLFGAEAKHGPFKGAFAQTANRKKTAWRKQRHAAVDREARTAIEQKLMGRHRFTNVLEQKKAIVAQLSPGHDLTLHQWQAINDQIVRLIVADTHYLGQTRPGWRPAHLGGNKLSSKPPGWLLALYKKYNVSKERQLKRIPNRMLRPWVGYG